jgi:threonine synthase
VAPTPAAPAAGLSRLIARGVIRKDETVVLVLTGSGLKASEKIGQLLKLAPRSL